MEKKGVEYQIIEIPAGTKFIKASNIPQWIAERLVSIPDTPPLMVHLKKKISGEEVDLTDEDVWLLRGVWSHIPFPEGWAMTPEQFALCRKVFEEDSGRPDWQLVPKFRDYRNEAKAERIKIASLHWKNINAAIQEGSLHALTKDRDIAHELDWGTLISTTEARAYIESLGFELRKKQILEQVILLPIEKPLQHQRGQEQEIYDLFDFLPTAGLAKMYRIVQDENENLERWKKWVDKAASNGLKQARTDQPVYKYNPAKVADWLVNKGTIDRARANRIRANNLPHRSKDKQHLITGDIE